MAKLSISKQVRGLQSLIGRINYISGWGEAYKFHCFVTGDYENEVIITGQLEDLGALYWFLCSLNLYAVMCFRSNLFPSESDKFCLDRETPNLKVSFH